MYISSLRKTGKGFRLPKYLFYIFLTFLVLTVFTVRFLVIATPFAENKARFIAINIINTGVSDYLKRNGDIIEKIINLSHSPDGRLTSASINTKNLNLIKSELTTEINDVLNTDESYNVKVPLANYLGITFLNGIGAPISLKMHPSSRVLVEFENNFSSSGINQTHLLLNLKVKATVIVTIPGMRKGVTVETDIPVGEAVFMGDVPGYYSAGAGLPLISAK